MTKLLPAEILDALIEELDDAQHAEYEWVADKFELPNTLHGRASEAIQVLRKALTRTKEAESTTVTEWGYRIESSGVEEWQGEDGRDGRYISANREYGVGAIDILNDTDAPNYIFGALNRAGVEATIIFRTITITVGETQTL